MTLLIRWFLNAAALMVIAYYVVPGIHLGSFVTALLAAAVLGLVNLLIRPLIMILTLPVNIITLGLFTFVVNALMFWLASSFVPGFSVVDFAAAFWGALCMSIASWLLQIILSRRRD